MYISFQKGTFQHLNLTPLLIHRSRFYQLFWCWSRTCHFGAESHVNSLNCYADCTHNWWSWQSLKSAKSLRLKSWKSSEAVKVLLYSVWPVSSQTLQRCFYAISNEWSIKHRSTISHPVYLDKVMVYWLAGTAMARSGQRSMMVQKTTFLLIGLLDNISW